MAMDNFEQLSELLSPLLSDPEAMNSLRQAAEQMGLGGLLPDGGVQSAAPPQATPPKEEPYPLSAPAGISPELLSTMGRLLPLLSSPAEDDSTRLLDSLRPFLSGPRAERLDMARQLLSIGRIISILKESKLM